MKDEFYYNELLQTAIENTDLTRITKSIAGKLLSVEVRGEVVGIYRDEINVGIITDEKLLKIKNELRKLIKKG